jgi:hypothetical protein
MSNIIQSIIFDKNKFNVSQLKKWIKKHNYTLDYGIDTKPPNYIRIRQYPPEYLEDYDYFTKDLNNGVKLVIAYQKKKNELLDKVKKNLKKYKIPYDKVELSPLPTKKIRLWVNGKPIDYGLKGSQTWVEGASETKKNSYQARASKITNKNKEFTYLIPYTKNNLSFFTLWT